MKKNKVWFTTVSNGKLVNIPSAIITKLKSSFVLDILPPHEILSFFLKSDNLIKKALLFFVLSIFTHCAFSQKADSTKSVYHFGGGVIVTNNGISLLPNLTLGKPAVIFDMSMGGRLSFEPQFRFSFEGKPWTFLFWWRYKLLETEKLRMNIGVHPAILFASDTSTINGFSEDVLVSKRYLAGEISPNYLLTENISIGMYYLYSLGFDAGTTNNVHFITINCKFLNIRLFEQFYMNFHPQAYYLRMDEDDGYYVTSTLTLARKKFPISISSIINKTIQTNIAASKDFVWNVSLIYSFNKEYVKNRKYGS